MHNQSEQKIVTRCISTLMVISLFCVIGCGPSKNEKEAAAAVKNDLAYFQSFLLQGANPGSLLAMQRVTRDAVDMGQFEEHHITLLATRKSAGNFLSVYQSETLDRIIRITEEFKTLSQNQSVFQLQDRAALEAKARLMMELNTKLFDTR